ncbi:membrane carboxypeptidase [Fictibacillus macauensis ZFHKF-1]|uniref:Membrane carboxypeptidase n=1 Tax=Fictibacillus macauensis ZFHKF-1 TaxID=1196324 RepID=I8UIH9_9BACL|nr:PBP1A family penicillin-binding protein [Fictibacillus macauensis]EIT86628.1 membrane carboxypeptidase [Fictibacillus macauensis ZFHKF-1]
MANYKSRQERRQAEGDQLPKKKRPFRFFKTLLSILLVCVLIGIIGIGLIIVRSPSLDPEKLKTPVSSQIFDKDGKRVTSLFNEQDRVNANIKDVPPVVKNAFIAVEDVRFYRHPGIDIRRIFGAALANVTGGFGSEGGSTITQQVVKNTLLSGKKSITRKIQEAYLALRLERNYSKDEILELYLNRIYFGHRAYGLGTAAKTYFNTDSLRHLKVHQAALLAGLPKAPSSYDPLLHPKAAQERRNVVLRQMEKYGFITKEESQKAQNTSIKDGLREGKLKETRVHEAYLQQVIKDLKQLQETASFDPYADGLKIYTNMDQHAQQVVEDALQNAPFLRNENKKLQSGTVLVDTKSGGIRAVGSGREKNVLSAYYASSNYRQPGSTIKPILDYGPAIEHLKWDTAHLLKDSPITVNGSTIHNFNNEHFGEVTMREAVINSENTPAVRTYLEVGNKRTVAFAHNIGINIKDASPAYAIGGFRRGITPLEMAGAYAAFGNNGRYTSPTTIVKVVTADGEEIKPPSVTKTAMKDYTAYMITDMLRDVVKSGTGRTVNISGLDLAGKTGTTNFSADLRKKYNIPKSAAVDAWMAGYSTSYTAAVWTGYDNYKDKDGVHYLTNQQQQYSKKLFKQIMSQLHHEGTSFKKPDSVTEVIMEKGTNKKAGPYTPSSQRSKELFVKGTEPATVSETYTKPPKVTGLRATFDAGKNEVRVTWDKVAMKDTSYRITYTVEGEPGNEELVNDPTFILSSPEQGKTYVFSVTTLDASGQESDAATTSITVKRQASSTPQQSEPPKPTQPEPTPNREPPQQPNEPNQKEQKKKKKKPSEEQIPETPPPAETPPAPPETP